MTARGPVGASLPRQKHRKSSRWVPWLAAIAVLTAAIAYIGGGNTAAGAGGKARVGRPAPDFTLHLFNGESVTLSSLKGKPILVNFWNSG